MPTWQELGKPFAKTVLDWRASDTIMLGMLDRLTFLSTLAGMICLMRASVGDILAAPGGAQAITRYLDACIVVATHEGYAPGCALTALMLRDMENGGLIEADHIVDFVLEKARAHGVDDGMLAVAYAHLKAYEVRRGRPTPP